MLKHGTAYKKLGQDCYESRYRQCALQNLKRRAKQIRVGPYVRKYIRGIKYQDYDMPER